MQTLMITLAPRSAFGGAIRGDTMFGQLCWIVRHLWGEQKLESLLEGYGQGRPFAVISDAFPEGYLPRPAIPLHHFREVTDSDRKQVKKLRWLPISDFQKPVSEWLRHAKTEQEIAKKGLAHTHSQPHNSINRMTGTTGNGDFAPYAMPQYWFATGKLFVLYAAFDETRISAAQMRTLFEHIGASGYGRDTSIGLGKFDCLSCTLESWPQQRNANAWLTLAPSAPQGMELDPGKSWYHPFTRFGRHGDFAVHLGRPFKTPLLMADTAAVLYPVQYAQTCFAGQGLGGDGSLSKAIANTVHQGYTPVLGIRMEEIS